MFFRYVREHRKIEMEKRLKEYNWTSVNNTRDASEAVSILTDAIGGMYNDCFPLIKVKVSSRDPPYMTPLVKHLCKMRNRQIRMGISPELQEKINILIRENQIRYSDIEFLIGTAVCPYPLEISQPCPDSKRTAFV